MGRGGSEGQGVWVSRMVWWQLVNSKCFSFSPQPWGQGSSLLTPISPLCCIEYVSPIGVREQICGEVLFLHKLETEQQSSMLNSSNCRRESVNRGRSWVTGRAAGDENIQEQTYSRKNLLFLPTWMKPFYCSSLELYFHPAACSFFFSLTVFRMKETKHQIPHSSSCIKFNV